MKGIKRYLGIDQGDSKSKSSDTYTNGGVASSSSSSSSSRFFSREDDLDRQARFVAERICSGFQLHDRRQRDECAEAFYAVDRHQFAHLDDDEAKASSEAYVEALWQKDDIEKSYQVENQIDPEQIKEADYEPIREPLARRAEIVGMDESYADHTATAWKLHKTKGEYWTEFLKAQLVEVRAALQDPGYPRKPKEGLSGFGPLPSRYLLSVELHDQHTTKCWEEAIRVMTPYYRRILERHRELDYR